MVNREWLATHEPPPFPPSPSIPNPTSRTPTPPLQRCWNSPKARMTPSKPRRDAICCRSGIDRPFGPAHAQPSQRRSTPRLGWHSAASACTCARALRVSVSWPWVPQPQLLTTRALSRSSRDPRSKTWPPTPLLSRVPARFHSRGNKENSYVHNQCPGPDTTLRPTTPATMRRIHRMRDASLDSPRIIIPMMAVPAAPIPVHTA